MKALSREFVVSRVSAPFRMARGFRVLEVRQLFEDLQFALNRINRSDIPSQPSGLGWLTDALGEAKGVYHPEKGGPVYFWYCERWEIRLDNGRIVTIKVAPDFTAEEAMELRQLSRYDALHQEWLDNSEEFKAMLAKFQS